MLGRNQEFIQGGDILCGEKFKIDGTGDYNESAQNKNRTVKSVNILTYFTFLRSF